MQRYVDVNGVHTWYDERGAGDAVVLLHGAIVDSRCFAGNLDALAGSFRLYLPERRGHGHTHDPGGPLSPQVMAADTVAFLQAVVGGPAALVGYSAGAVVALLTALARPDLVSRLVLISGAFHQAGWLLPPAAPADIPQVIHDQHAEVSPDGPGHLAGVVERIAASARAGDLALTAASLRAVGCRTLVLVGDDDAVSLEHTLQLYRGLPDAELAVVPRATHTLLAEHPRRCTDLVATFLSEPPAPTHMPIRRA
ncbi:alpha/beta hydrolase [Dactylosporangium sp. NBC_01737]|uniref:alpha/beta fold hydrolase n=1 Tax=Dactylosporangium sp. NBC_01737 TaxID=2975959 RepID=UPI002E0E4D77|nr:alpha/beta hydrolase [Dactylosporangium sp. NBC_01737]